MELVIFAAISLVIGFAAGYAYRENISRRRRGLRNWWDR
jgi:hypothetical protein